MVNESEDIEFEQDGIDQEALFQTRPSQSIDLSENELREIVSNRENFQAYMLDQFGGKSFQ